MDSVTPYRVRAQVRTYPAQKAAMKRLAEMRGVTAGQLIDLYAEQITERAKSQAA